MGAESAEQSAVLRADLMGLKTAICLGTMMVALTVPLMVLSLVASLECLRVMWLEVMWDGYLAATKGGATAKM